MIKKALSLFIALLLITSAIPSFSVSASATYNGTCGSNLTWELDESTGVLTISGTGDMTNYSSSSAVPWYSYRSSIKEVLIPEGVTSIGNFVFSGCTGLTEIVIPDSVDNIGYQSFYDCTGLTEIAIPDNVTSIRGWAFDDCTGLTKVNINSLEAWCNIDFYSYASNPLYFAKHLYLNGTEITKLEIPNTVTSISAYAFRNCIGLTEIIIPDSVISIGSHAFNECTGLTKVNINSLEAWCNIDFSSFGSNPLRYAKHLYLNGTEVTKLEIPNTIVSIKPYAFFNCVGLTSVTIQKSVTSIENYAFSGCAGLTEIVIPDSVVSIGNQSFCNCTGLTEIAFPNSVKSIDIYAFSGCTSLTEITIPNSVISIGEYAFNACTGLTKVNINSLEAWCNIDFGSAEANPLYFAKHLYSNGTEITKLEIPSTIANIQSYAFYNCIGLTEITIPDSVISIGGWAFCDCTGLTKVNINSLEAWCNIDFSSYASNPLRYAKHLYLNGTEITKLEIPNTIVNIQSFAFCNCIGLTEITIPDSVTNIGFGAFNGCVGLTQITIPKTVTDIGRNAFSDCPNLVINVHKNSCAYDYVVANNLKYFISSFDKPNSPTLYSKTNTTIVLNSNKAYEYMLDGGEWQDSNVFSNLTPNTTYKFYQRVKATDNNVTSPTSEALSVTTKSSSAKPSAPSLESKTSNSVTLTYIEGQEYKKDDGEWQKSNVFMGLSPNSNYTFYCRIAETENIYYSVQSDGLVVTTNKETISAPNAPALYYITDTTVALVRHKDYQYRINNGDWQDNTVFTNLTPNTTYSFYQRVKETDICYASESSEALTVKTKAVPSKPNAPTLSSKTDTSVTLNKVNGCEYKIEGGSWQDSNVFSGLTPNTTYKFYQRIKATDNNIESQVSEALTVKTKAVPSKPNTPTLSSKNDTSVTLNKVNGYEYKIEGGSWQDSNIFSGLTPNTTYKFYQRVKETDDNIAGQTSEALTVKTKAVPSKPNAPTLSSKTDTSVTLNKVNGCEYKIEGGSWQDSNVFSGLTPNTTYKFYQRVKETDNNIESQVSEALTVKTKAVPSKPNAPTLSGKTSNSVTLTALSGYEYRMDDGVWQSSNVFSGLEPNSTHTFYQRKLETEEYVTSVSSNGLTVTTNKLTVSAPIAPILYDKTDTKVILVSFDGYEYKMDNGGWQSSAEFYCLEPGSTHKFYQRIAETDTSYASPASAATSITTNDCFASGVCGDNLIWKFYSNGLLKISGTGAMYDYSSIAPQHETTNAPWFEFASNIKKVKIYSGATNVGNFAFYNCTKIEELQLPSTVKTIDSNAFNECKALSSLTLPNSITDIEQRAFRNCISLKTLTVPNSVVNLGHLAFAGCEGLEKVKIGTGVKKIEMSFSGCYNIKVVDNYSTYRIDGEKGQLNLNNDYNGDGSYLWLADTVNWYPTESGSCGKNAKWSFSYKTATLKITGSGEMYSYSNDDELYDEKAPWCKYNILIKSIQIDDGITKLSVGAFKNCPLLTSVTVPNSVKYIGYGTFLGCNALKSITVPFIGVEYNGIEHTNFASIFGQFSPDGEPIGGAAPSSITKVIITGGNRIDNNAFLKCNNIKEVVITGNVRTIDTGAFIGCRNLEKIAIPNSVLIIYGDAFIDCDLLTIYCCKGSEAEKIAKAYKFPVKYLKFNVKLSYTSTVYNSKVRTPSVSIKSGEGVTLKKGVDYKVYYPSGRRNVGTYKIKIVLMGNYSGTKYISFKIKPITTGIKTGLSTTAYTYNGRVKTPTVTVRNANGTKLTKDVHYTVTYQTGRKNVGKYKVTIKMKGNYSGTKTLYFKINPAKTTVKSLTAGKKSLKVAITKKSTQVTGYQIQYSTSKTFKSAKLKTVGSYKTTSTTLSKLLAKKTYYVRVRTYKTVNGVKYYSGWSTYKYKKTK